MLSVASPIMQVGSVWYFIMIALGALSIVGAYFALRRLSPRARYWAIFGLFLFNFILHFAKLLFSPYREELPYSIRKVTFENICAVSTLLFPWIFLWRKNRGLQSYLYFVGVFGGLAAFFYPTNTLGNPLFSFDSLRFYVNHWILIAGPFLAAALHVILPNARDWWKIVLYFLAIEVIIAVNEYFVGKAGWIYWEKWDKAFYLDRNTRNSSFVFGPDGAYDGATGFIRALVPRFLRTDWLHINGGVDFYFPVLWMVIPAFIYLSVLYEVLALPFTASSLKKAILRRKKESAARGEK